MNDNASSFQTLHPDTIMDALFEQGIRVDSGLTPLNSYENRVYQFQDEDRRRFVVEFYRPERQSVDQIQEGHQFALEPVSDEVSVAAPLVLNGQTLLGHQGFHYAIFPSVNGRQFETDNTDQMEAVKRYLGRMHQTGSRCTFAFRPTIGLEEYLTEPRRIFEHTQLIPSRQKAVFLKTTDALIAVVTKYWRTRFTTLCPHSDCHADSILWRDDPMPVGLDDARNGPAIQDLRMPLNGDKAGQHMQLKTIIETYGEFSKFNISEIGLIEPLRAMRLVYYLAQLVRRWADPALPKNFPWLTGEGYWHRQATTPIERAKILQEPSLQLTPIY